MIDINRNKKGRPRSWPFLFTGSKCGEELMLSTASGKDQGDLPGMVRIMKENM